MSGDGGADAAEIVADPQWFPHRYDVRRDEIHFVRLPRAAHRSGRFLTDPELTAGAPIRILPRRVAEAAPRPQGPLHLILHSGLTGSTLLARALDHDGVSMSLIEPQILTDLVAHRLNGASHRTAEELLGLVSDLFARPFSPGEAVIVKMSSVGNALGLEMLARRPASRALCLHAPLPVFLASIARKGLWGRHWGRKLLIGLRNSGAVDLGFSDSQYLEQTDLQVAACAWLSIHRMLAAAGMRFGDARTRATDSERVTGDLAGAAAAVAAHFGLALRAPEIDAVLRGRLGERHAKTGEAYDPVRRAQELAAAAAAHGEEIEMVTVWARKIADTFAIPWELPGQLTIGGQVSGRAPPEWTGVRRCS